jgi:hypothetical protein
MIQQIKADRKTQLMLGGVLLAVCFVACVMCYMAYAFIGLGARQAAPPASPASPATAEPEPKPEPLKFEGNGDATQKFSVAGIRTMQMVAVHVGERAFIVHVVDLQTGRTDYLINKIGKYEGSVVVKFPSDGDYILEVKAKGGWGIQLVVP